MIESLMAEQGANSRLPWIGVVAPSVEGALVAQIQDASVASERKVRPPPKRVHCFGVSERNS